MSSPPPRSEGPHPPSDREIHRLFDGDLTPEELAALRETEKKRDLRGISGTRAKLEALGELRALIREASSDETPAIDADAAWAQIAARIEGAENADLEARASSPRIAGSRPALRVIEGGLSDKALRETGARIEARAGDDGEARGIEREESAPAGLLKRNDGAAGDRDDESKRRERQVQRRRTLIMLVSGLAAAAAAAITFLAPGEPAPVDTVAIESDETGAPAVDRLAEEQLRRTEVITVDFGSNTGTVFSVEGAEGARYAVVWLADEAEKEPDATTDEPVDEAPATESDDGANLGQTL